MGDDPQAPHRRGAPAEVVKTCRGCGATYDARAFLALPFRGRRVSPFDPIAIQSMNGRDDDLLLRDCQCGSTLGLSLPRILASSLHRTPSTA